MTIGARASPFPCASVPFEHATEAAKTIQRTLGTPGF
jgi:hypothetical protein